ncbi:hypothetical protein T492DRAFT_1027854 [Pavlovales sp. CCMP2436]|nr:hypothetical protein T492DRAFT_1027854 [Pavlovales sp. CCMP2436]|mmetsp:Transcript_29589/g.74398  ORF Transcript_29589/g.74398 Transcript_29589/m.74398 type:complete len:130 (-) Transcript_29589:344-733(-)
MAMMTIRFLYAVENREFTFTDVPTGSTIAEVKQSVVDKWPADLPAQTKPPDAAHVRLLFAGSFLEDGTVLRDVAHILITDTTTFHLIVMAPPAEKSASAAAPNEKAAAAGGDAGARGTLPGPRCMCAIS